MFALSKFHQTNEPFLNNAWCKFVNYSRCKLLFVDELCDTCVYNMRFTNKVQLYTTHSSRLRSC